MAVSTPIVEAAVCVTSPEIVVVEGITEGMATRAPRPPTPVPAMLIESAIVRPVFNSKLPPELTVFVPALVPSGGGLLAAVKR